MMQKRQHLSPEVGSICDVALAWRDHRLEGDARARLP
jgi:hypothetical protein